MQALKYFYSSFFLHTFLSCKETVCSICSVGNCFTFYRKTLPLYIVQFSKNLYPFGLVEISRIELLTPCLQGRCSPS